MQRETIDRSLKTDTVATQGLKASRRSPWRSVEISERRADEAEMYVIIECSGPKDGPATATRRSAPMASSRRKWDWWASMTEKALKLGLLLVRLLEAVYHFFDHWE
jgi:hypothetical protein